jgi:hypothetical protein
MLVQAAGAAAAAVPGATRGDLGLAFHAETGGGEQARVLRGTARRTVDVFFHFTNFVKHVVGLAAVVALIIIDGHYTSPQMDIYYL